MKYVLGVVVFLISGCSSVIYELDDIQHERMPGLFTLDDYDHCLRHEGTYCTARITLFADPPNDLFKLIQNYSAYTTKHYNHTFVDRGVCINTTCQKYIKDNNTTKVDEINNILEKCLNNTMTEKYQLQSKLSHVFSCNTKSEQMDIDVYDWIVLGVVLLLVAVNVAGSVYDLITTSNKPAATNKFLQSFSIVKNWQWMVSWRNEDEKFEDLKSLYAVKALVTLLVVLAHAIFIISVGFTDNSHDFEKVYDYVVYQLIFNGMAVIQIYFVMSGFLLVYGLRTSGQKSFSWLLLPKILIYRWWRLTPVYTLLVAFNATWLRHLGSGPVWSVFVSNSVVADCRRYWWYHVLYIHNYQPLDKFCALPTWHVAAEMQMFVVGLCLYLATQRRGHWAAVATLLLVGIAAPMLHVWLQDLDGLTILTPETYRSLDNATFGAVHIRGHTNLAGYALGMGLGYLVYHLHKENVKISQYKYISYAFWFVIPVVVLLFYSGTIFYVDGPRATLTSRMLYAGCQRLVIAAVMGFGLVALFMRCVPEFLSRLLKWQGWLAPGKLSYTVYLINMDLVSIVLGTQHQPVRVSFFYMMINYFAIVVISYLIAIPLYLMVEVPLTRLMKAAIGGTSTKDYLKKAESTVNITKI